MAQQDKQLSEQLERERAQRDDENRRRFTDQSGLEASELPGHGRDEPADTNVQKEMGRNLPQQHGGGEAPDQEGGLRGDRDISDADLHGNRGRA
jgi:hypothetical protein